MTNEPKLVPQEQMKIDSRYLKGTIAEELADPTIHEISDYAYEMLKFHGSYFGYNRDTATERKKAGLDKEWEFMVRTRIPAGRLTAEQYLALDDLAGKYANASLRITTRQTIQFHVILKEHMKAHIAGINEVLLSTIGGCGDVTRNITTSPAPYKDAKHLKLLEDAERVAAFVKPKTSAYREIWLDEEADEVREREVVPDHYEPLYGPTYMPRKFKIGLILPEDNSIDVFTHDLGIVLVYEGKNFKGYNLLLGGGMGMDHEGKLTWKEKKTFPRLATPIAFAGPHDLLNAVEAVVKLQRDHGDRTNRKHARLKYVLADKGEAWVRATLEEYFHATNPKEKLRDPVEIKEYAIPSHMGWREQGDGKWFLGLPVPSGRIVDYDVPNPSGYHVNLNAHFKDARYRTGLREVISEYGMNLVLTPTEEIILCDIEESQKAEIERKLKSYGIKLAEEHTKFELNFMACVALPTCAKALAESERVQFPLMDDIQAALTKHGLRDERIAVRVTGCPNGCARPYVGDIGIVGRMPGHYLLFIGGDFEGTRLGTRVLDKVPQNDIARALDPMFALWATERRAGEGFGDFCTRYGVRNVAQVAVEANAGAKWAEVIE